MKLSGPQKSVRMPASSRAGKRRIATSRNGAIRSQSGGSTANALSRGVPSSAQAFATGSNIPTSRPPPSSR